MTTIKSRLTKQTELDSLKTTVERNILGQFATPPSLATDIVTATVKYLPTDESIRFLEPALGTGAFFESLVGQVNSRVEKALGVEIDPAFAHASEDLWRGTCLKIINEDFTRLEPLRLGYRCNLLITNPPYVRHHHIDGNRKIELVKLSQKASGIRLSGLAGLYAHFMMIAHTWLEPDAVSAWLIPSEFMDVNYGDGLKKYLTGRVELLRIHRFCPKDVQFDDALVTSTVVIFRNRLPKPTNMVSCTFGATMTDPGKLAQISIKDLSEVRKWSNLADPKDNLPTKPLTTLGEAFTIRRGLATGDNRFFIRPLTEFEALGIPHEFLKPILPAPRNVQDLTIHAGMDGYPLLDQKLALFDCSLSESELERSYPMVSAFVQEGKARGVDQGYLCNGRKPWYSQERREAPPLVCTYMGRAKADNPPFRIIRNKSKAIATNVYLLLYPKPWLLKADHDGKLVDRICAELRRLSSDVFTSEGRVYGGGLHKMEPKELARLPLHMHELVWADKGIVQGVLFERRRSYQV